MSVPFEQIAAAIATIVPDVVRGCELRLRGAVVQSAGETRATATTTFPAGEAALVLFHDAPLEGLAARVASVTAQHVSALLERERAVTERDEALSMIAHELRSPLQALTMGTYLLTTRLRGTADEIPREWLLDRCEKLERSTRRLVALGETMLDAARGAVPPHGDDEPAIDVGAVVDEVVGSAAGDLSWASSAVTVTKRGELTGPWNKVYLERIVTNLLSNAGKYASGKAVAVDIDGCDDAVVIRVRDQGPGISAADVERIFVRFFRGANAARNVGLGVGLWVVDNFVRQLGGTVICESVVGTGTTFVVTLPRRPVSSGASPEELASPSR